MLAFGSLVAPNLQGPANEWVITNTVRWLPIIHQLHPDYPELDPAWVLAVIAQESMGESDVVGGDRVGSVGLMQIAPFDWRPSTGRLKNPYVNIQWGMGILDTLQKRHSGNLRLSLATYNCGEHNLALGHCGRHGGYAYADVVMDLWTPAFRFELQAIANGKHAMADWMDSYYPDDSVYDWLATLGYLEGLGNWEVVPEIKRILCRVLPARRFRSRMCIGENNDR